MKKRLVRVVTIAGLALAIGLGSAAAASAQGPTPFGRRGGIGLPGSAEVLESIAEMLGLSADELSLQLWGGRTLADLAEKAGVDLADVQEKVRTSREDAQRTAIEEALAEGRITQEHADWLLEGLDNGYSADLGTMRRGLLGADLMMRDNEQPQHSALAEALGMTTEELTAQLRNGKTLADLADEAGVPLQELKDAADAAHEARVREAIEVALENEAITAEQADWLLRGLEAGYWQGGDMAARMPKGRGWMAGAMFRGEDLPPQRPNESAPGA